MFSTSWTAPWRTHFLGQIWLASGNYGRAARHFIRGLHAARRVPDRFTILVSLYDLALSSQGRGDLADAARLLKEGVSLAAETGDTSSVAYYLEALAAVAGLRDHPEHAAVLLSAARALLDATGRGWLHAYVPRSPHDGAVLATLRSRLGDTWLSSRPGPMADPSGACSPCHTRWEGCGLARSGLPSCQSPAAPAPALSAQRCRSPRGGNPDVHSAPARPPRDGCIRRPAPVRCDAAAWFPSHPGQPLPQLRTADGHHRDERRASTLELFFDLVVAGAVGQLAGALQEYPALGALARFVMIFTPIWWLWVQLSFYADRHEARNAAYRGAYLTAMLLCAALGVSAARALAGDAAGFIVAFALLRALQLVLYAGARRHLPATRRLYGRYLVFFGIGGALWLSSLTVAAPVQYAFWARPACSRTRPARWPCGRLARASRSTRFTSRTGSGSSYSLCSGSPWPA